VGHTAGDANIIDGTNRMPHLQTTNVFIDTQYFTAANFNFESKALKELIRLAEAGVVNVFSTEITKDEVASQIDESLREAVRDIEKLRNRGRVLRNLDAFKEIFEDLDVAGAAGQIRDRLEQFIQASHTTVLDFESSDPADVFAKYFQHEHPFGQSKKKHEFPDAFAQSMLIGWCETHHTRMYVISLDSDWQDLVNQQTPLLPLPKLESFIDLALKDEQEVLSNRALELYRANIDTIRDMLSKEFRESGFYIEDEDGGIDDIHIKNIDFGEPLVVDFEQKVGLQFATISVTAEVRYEADIYYEDSDSGIWDGEDKKWLWRDTKNATVEETEHVEVEVTIEYDPHDARRPPTFVVDLNSFEFAITARPTDWELK
jgi:hypothetical protein